MAEATAAWQFQDAHGGCVGVHPRHRGEPGAAAGRQPDLPLAPAAGEEARGLRPRGAARGHGHAVEHLLWRVQGAELEGGPGARLQRAEHLPALVPAGRQGQPLQPLVQAPGGRRGLVAVPRSGLALRRDDQRPRVLRGPGGRQEAAELADALGRRVPQLRQGAVARGVRPADAAAAHTAMMSSREGGEARVFAALGAAELAEGQPVEAWPQGDLLLATAEAVAQPGEEAVRHLRRHPRRRRPRGGRGAGRALSFRRGLGLWAAKLPDAEFLRTLNAARPGQQLPDSGPRRLVLVQQRAANVTQHLGCPPRQRWSLLLHDLL
mmetsp:Transcript_105810/g.341361  ORF Transcript_105810/g.341361 Transcript_105810/m.341361 type:complete len:322 (+) Transcript_105810:807-1772(+)